MPVDTSGKAVASTSSAVSGRKRGREPAAGGAGSDDAALLAAAGLDGVDAGWQRALLPCLRAPAWASLRAFVSAARARGAVYPADRDVFAALAACPLERVRVVILGQDPYHGAGQAHGLAFSVPAGVAVPPSLRNMLKEVADDVGGGAAPGRGAGGSLAGWAAQGVLLLNSALTVAAGAPGSHAGVGWEAITRAALAAVLARPQKTVLLLWGKPAQAQAAGLDVSRATVLTAPHPSPLSAFRGFFGCKHFSRANAALAHAGVEPVDWLARDG